MQLIKKIIGWLISLLRMIFGKKSNKKKKSSQGKNNVQKSSNKNKIKGIVTEINETMPGYMYLSDCEKALLIEKLKEVRKIVNKKSDDYLKKEISEIIQMLDECVKKDNVELKERINTFSNNVSKGIDKNTNKEFELLLNYVPKVKKEEISKKYYSVNNYNNLVKENIKKIDTVINTIEKRPVTIVEKNEIIDISDNVINSKNENLLNDLEKYNKDMLYVMKNINKNILDKVKIEYKKINYITLSTELLDEIQVKLKRIEDNYSSHRYNKYYYEREIDKIKKQIFELKELKNNPQVFNEILALRKELYTKSKDKYDILYNNEIFMNINQKCDNLINKVNAKVVDIKKEKEKDKKSETKKKNDYMEKIILRFQDMALARQLILDNDQQEIKNDKEMILYIQKMFNRFADNTNAPFNYERNKEKTDLVILFNQLNRVNCYLKKEQYIQIGHINFRMNDLLDAVMVKKEELSNLMKARYNIDITNQLVDEKINKLLRIEKGEKPKNLVKKDNKQN